MDVAVNSCVSMATGAVRLVQALTRRARGASVPAGGDTPFDVSGMSLGALSMHPAHPNTMTSITVW